jgi:hypothetical protein
MKKSESLKPNSLTVSKNKLFLIYLLFTMNGFFLYAEPHYPVDVSYLVADFKYSQEHGIKICEVQHGALSAIQGDLYLFGEEGSIPPLFAEFFARFPLKKWAVGLVYPPLKRSLEAKEWDVGQSIKALLKDSTFLECAVSPPADPFSITSYTGMVFADFYLARHFNSYRKAYPGILIMNAVTFPYWKDKYKMNALFNLNDELKQYKADWRLYPKKYDPCLSDRIREEIPSEFYVIKPRKEALANGLIVVASQDLDHVLHMILEHSASLENHSDQKYAYWANNKDDTFLIEKYYPSDHLRFSLPLDGKITSETEYRYDATMRLAFILQYDRGKMTYHGLGGFWKLPSKALEEEGTLNEKMISCCKPPFYRPIEPQLFEEVNLHLERAMLLLYEKMLN